MPRPNDGRGDDQHAHVGTYALVVLANGHLDLEVHGLVAIGARTGPLAQFNLHIASAQLLLGPRLHLVLKEARVAAAQPLRRQGLVQATSRVLGSVDVRYRAINLTAPLEVVALAPPGPLPSQPARLLYDGAVAGVDLFLVRLGRCRAPARREIVGLEHSGLGDRLVAVVTAERSRVGGLGGEHDDHGEYGEDDETTAHSHSHPTPSWSASRPCGSDPSTWTSCPTSGQSTSGGYGGTQPE
jgi:hypothetical protein